MAQFVGEQTSLRDEEYIDLRARTSQRPYNYLTRFVPNGLCPKDVPYTCGWAWSEGGSHLAPDVLRVGKGLTRDRRRDSRPWTELKGRSAFQYGQTPWTGFAATVDRSRNKYEYAVQCTSSYMMAHAPPSTPRVEPFVLGGISTRIDKDFA